MNIRFFSLLALAGCTVFGVSCAGSGTSERSGNPIFEGWYADPEAVVYDGTCWVYPTSSLPYDEQLSFDCFSSDDLVHWTKHTGILKQADVAWARRAMWAPAAIRKDGRYYFFFAANDVHEGEVGGIGVAVSDRPEGPYRDLLGKPLINEIVNGAQPIDQFVYEHGGEYYMYYGGWGHCNVVRLKEDFTGIRPFDDGELYKEITPERYTEGPFLFERKGKYYFMWSEGAWTGPDYSVAYAVSDSPLGPFERIGTIMRQDPAVATGAGHHSVIRIPGTDDYYIVYHRHPLGDGEGAHRQVCIERMTFDAEGRIEPVRLTFEGVEVRDLSRNL
ncbi:MAG: glycoside hydrolase family 43 protein [Alistipes dispar]